MSSKREREYARRRHEKWLAHQDEVRARAQRRRTLAAWILGGVLLAGVVALGIGLVRSASDDATPAATAQESTEQDAPAQDESVPDPALAEGRTWTAVLSTSIGDLTLELDGAAAPQAVASFVSLSASGFFEGTSCHRLTTIATDGIAVLQCGDPTGTGTGGPGYTFGPIENAPADDVYPAGTVAMARTSGDGSSMGSQFFLVYEDSTIPADSAGGYTVLGRVTDGLDLLTQVGEAGIDPQNSPSPVTPVTIEKVETT